MTWAPDYVTSADLKAYLGITDTVDDAQLALAVAAASRAVDRATNRQFGLVAAPEERVYTARWDKRRCRWVVEIDDLMTAVGLTVTTDAGTVDVFDLQPGNAAGEGLAWTRLVVAPESAVQPTADENGVSVTAQWGWAAVPATVKQATLLQASRLFARRKAPFGVAGSPELGSELRLLARLDPDVAVVLGPYTRWWAAA
jgi:uncharacterized phiE125 gp8 family phage protein